MTPAAILAAGGPGALAAGAAIAGPTLIARNIQGKNRVFDTTPDLNRYAHFGIPGEDDNNEYLLRAFSRDSLSHLNQLAPSKSTLPASAYVETVEDPVENLIDPKPATKSSLPASAYVETVNTPKNISLVPTKTPNKGSLPSEVKNGGGQNNLDWLNILLPLIAAGGLGYLAGRR